MIESTLYCVCKICEQYSEYSKQDFSCEAGHPQTKTAFYKDADETEFIFKCPNHCSGGAVYLDEKCMGCGERFSKVDKKDKTTGVRKPHNYVVLYESEDVERDRQTLPKRTHWNEDNRDDPVCPVCEELNANSFIFDGEKIRSLGFSPIEDSDGNFSPNEIAPFGLCPSESCIDKVNPYVFAVPLVLRRTKDAELDASGYDVRGTGDYIGQICQICRSDTYEPDEKQYPTCNACGHQVAEVFDSTQGRGVGGTMAYSMRNRYLKALGIRKHIVDPPYYFVSAENPFANPPKPIEAGEKLPEERKSPAKQPNEWFTCLRPYLADLESTSESKLEHIIVATYVDKTFCRGHIEPLWMFAEREGVGNKITRAFNSASKQSATFDKAIADNVNAVRPSEDSIECVYQLIKQSFGQLWPLNATANENEEDVDLGILQCAIKGMNHLESSGYLSKMYGIQMLSEPFSLSGRITLAPGLIETFCILWSVQKKNTNHHRQLRNKIFPDTRTAYWRTILSDRAIRAVEKMQYVFNVMNREEDKSR